MRSPTITQYECDGKLSIFFPKKEDASFDVAVNVSHRPHPGCEQFGIPVVVREWIKNNPRSSGDEQRKALFRAIEKGEIDGISPAGLVFYRAPLINYWWHKGVRKTQNISTDPFINMEHNLRIDPQVISFQIQLTKATCVIYNENPRKHLIWLIHHNYPVDLSKVKDVFIDATYNTSKMSSHLYAIVTEEYGHSMTLAFMQMEVLPKEDTKSRAHEQHALQCNKNFYQTVKEQGLVPMFFHTDKDFAQITAAQVNIPILKKLVRFALLKTCIFSGGY